MLAALPLLGSIVTWVAAGVTSAAAGLGVAWQRSPLGRARRRARRGSKPIIREGERFDRSLERWRKPIERAAERYAEDAQKRILAELPLDALREHGASGVRLDPLREAGMQNVGDLVGVSAKRLDGVRGIGDKSAGRLVRATRSAVKAARAEGAPLPSADLTHPEEQVLAAATLDLVDAREVAGEEAVRLRRAAADLARERRAVDRDTSFGRWLVGPLRRAKNRAAAERGERLAQDAAAIVESGLLERAREGRKRVSDWRPPRRERGAGLERFRDRYAECCAMLEEVFVRCGLRPARESRGGRGGVTDEVARRVEAFELRATGLKATLRPYQEFGAKYLLAQERTILGDEMGLGKTMQTLAAMVHLAERDPKARFFVVAPAGLLLNWQREVERFTSLPAYLLYGDDFEVNLARWIGEGGVAITSYATLRSADLGAVLETRSEGLDLVVADEAHYIKNPEAGRTQAVRRVLERSSYAALLSGTPMENHPREFLELIDAIRERDAGELRGMDLDLDGGRGGALQFHAAVAKIYLRRNQEDVLTELPERLEVEEWVDPTPEGLSAYRAQVAKRNFMGMRQAATLGADGVQSAKLDRLEELLEDHRASGRKVLVFSYFLDVLTAVAKRFGAVGTISGKLGPHEKQELCDAFQATDGHAILLSQIVAGGVGLNLQAASVVVLCEPQTKPSTESQAIARAHRMGQTRRVLVHRLLARGTCDEPLVQILAEKSELFDAYARKSLVKEASREATETSVAKFVIEAEAARHEEIAH